MANDLSIVRSERAAKAVVLIRILAGWAFLSEGIQKFLFPDALGVGRFIKIGIPCPHAMAPFVGTVEIVCGSLVLAGLFTRIAAVPLLGVISVALYSTKIAVFAKFGFWGTLHDAQTDVSMLLGLTFLTLVGGGSWSLEKRSARTGQGESENRVLRKVAVYLLW